MNGCRSCAQWYGRPVPRARCDPARRARTPFRHVGCWPCRAALHGRIPMPLPAAVRVAAVSKPPRKVVLMVDGGAVGQVRNEYGPVPVAPVAAFTTVEATLGYHFTVRVALKRVAFTTLVLHPGKAVVAVFLGGNDAYTYGGLHAVSLYTSLCFPPNCIPYFNHN